jgi:hypothetical protein
MTKVQNSRLFQSDVPWGAADMTSRILHAAPLRGTVRITAYGSWKALELQRLPSRFVYIRKLLLPLALFKPHSFPGRAGTTFIFDIFFHLLTATSSCDTRWYVYPWAVCSKILFLSLREERAGKERKGRRKVFALAYIRQEIWDMHSSDNGKEKGPLPRLGAV